MIKVIKKIARVIFCKVLFRVKIEGSIDYKENYVIVANHNTSMDAIFLWTNIQNLCVMAKEELFKFKPMAAVLRYIGAFPIARGKKDFSHVYHAVKVVENKNNLLIFPEGTRKAVKKGVKAKNGATYIAAAADVKIIPVYISEKLRLFGQVKIKINEPVVLKINKENIKDRELLGQETERIMNIIYNR